MKRKNPARRLHKRLWISLTVLAGLIILHQFLIQPVLIQMTSDAPVINLAGRQRMLSQKLCKAALALVGTTDMSTPEARRSELATTLEEWRAAQASLRAGEPVTVFGRFETPAIQKRFREIEPHFVAMADAADILLGDPDTIAGRAALDSILRNEQEFLSQMHAIVGLYQNEARRHVRQLQYLGLTIVLLILGTLLAMQFGVMRPELRNAGREWEQIEADYELIVESMTDGLVVLDNEGRVRFANRRFGDMLGQVPNQIIGQLASDFIKDRDQTQFEKFLTAKSRVIGPFDLQLRCSNGREIDALISPRRMSDVDGNLQRLLIVVTDVTSRKAIERRSRELQMELAHADRLKSMGTMAAALAHEINQPLGAISIYAEGCLTRLSETPSNPEELVAPLQGILRASKRGAEIIRRTKDFARRSPHRLKPESINVLIHEVEELCRPEARRRNVSIELNLADNLPEVPVDGIQIQQVLMNLIQNSFIALEKVDHFQRRIKLTTRLSVENEVETSIADSGPGLPKQALQTWFKPFVTTQTHGTGLGLAIARGIVESHGGRIWNETICDEGAVFRFTLPLLPLSTSDGEFTLVAEDVNVG